MPWSQHTPYRQPPDWKATRKRIMRRDHGTCHICHKPGANEIDHLIPVTEGGSDNDHNLAPIHHDPCHKDKTQAEAARARANKPKAQRPSEQHPGLI